MVRDKTRLLLDSYFSATKLAWLLAHLPGARRRAERGELCFGTVDSYLLFRLTDRLVPPHEHRRQAGRLAHKASDHHRLAIGRRGAAHLWARGKHLRDRRRRAMAARRLRIPSSSSVANTKVALAVTASTASIPRSAYNRPPSTLVVTSGGSPRRNMIWARRSAVWIMDVKCTCRAASTGGIKSGGADSLGESKRIVRWPAAPIKTRARGVDPPRTTYVRSTPQRSESASCAFASFPSRVTSATRPPKRATVAATFAAWPPPPTCRGSAPRDAIRRRNSSTAPATTHSAPTSSGGTTSLIAAKMSTLQAPMAIRS